MRLQRGNDDERALVQRLRRGDEEALAAVTVRWLDPVYAFVFHRVAGDQQAAEDITQETFLAAFDALERFDARSGLYTWLCGIARHKLADHYRRLHRLELTRLALGHATGSPDEPGDDLLREERRREVLAALRALPARYQQALTLKYVERMSGRDLALSLGLSEDAAESLLARARAAFRRAWRAGQDRAAEGEIHESA